MKAKLIKVVIGDEYRLDDEKGVLIASTLKGCKSKISIKNCQAIERGYDLDELANEKFPIHNTGTMFMPNTHEVNNVLRQEGFKAGFQIALELMGDKKYTNLDLIEAIAETWNKKKTTIEIIESLQQTEWDVEIEMRSKNIDELRESNEGFLNNPNLYVPELDENGCLILKRV